MRESIIKINFRVMVGEDEEWMKMAADRIQRRTSVNTTMNYQVIETEGNPRSSE
jgi:hypothetical protein